MFATTLALPLLNAQPASAAWYDTNFGYKERIVVDHTKVSGASDLTDYPLSVALTDPNLRTVGNGGHVQNASGYDIVFLDSTESSVLDFETESYSATTGALSSWVRLPLLSRTVDTVIWLYFGNTSITSSQENRNGVWDTNYRGVWHLGENSGTTNADSSVNASNATKASSVLPNPLSPAKIGGGQTFNASTAYETVAGSSVAITGDKTVEAWVSPASFAATTGGVSQRIVYDYVDATNTYQLNVCEACNSGKGFAFQVNDNTGLHEVDMGGSAFATDTWYHLVGVYTAASHTVTLYVNGSSTTSGGADSYSTTSPTGLNFGRRSDNVGHFNGKLDEVRVSNSSRPAGWVITTFNNQSSASTFFTVDSLSAAGGTIVSAIVDPSFSFTVAGRASVCNGQSATNFQTGASPTAVSLGHLSSSTVGGGAQDLSIATNAANGFVVYLKTSGTTPHSLRDTVAHSIADVTGTNASPGASPAAGTAGFGYTSSDPSTPFTSNTWAKLTNTNASILIGAAGTSSKSACIGYEVAVASTTPAGTYSSYVVYTAIPTF